MAGDAEARLAYVAQVLGDLRQLLPGAGWRWPMRLEAAYLIACGRQEAPRVVSTVDGGQDRAMTYQEVAQRLAVSPRSVDRLVAAGELPVVEIAGTARVRASDVDAYLAGLPVRGRAA